MARPRENGRLIRVVAIDLAAGGPVRRSASYGAAGAGHQPLGVGRVDRRGGGRLDQTELAGGVGAGRLEDVGEHRDLVRLELKGSSEAGRDVPGMSDGVDDGEVD